MRWYAPLAAVVAMLAVAPGAGAAITTSDVTTPADGTLVFQNADTNPNQTVTVAGTTNSTAPATDKIDIDCYQGGFVAPGEVYTGSTPAGISLASDGSFSVGLPPDFVPLGDSCVLLAVPHSTQPEPPTGYTGPRVGLSVFQTFGKISGGPNNGKAYDFGFGDNTLAGSAKIDSIDDCGPFQRLFTGPAMDFSPILLNCAGQFYNSSPDFGALGNDLTRSEILVDGKNAYGSNSAHYLTSASDANSGFPALSASLDSFNTATRDAQTTESETLAECSPNDVYDPSQFDCSSFKSSGVRIKRVTNYTSHARVATVVDTYTSTDGKAHALDLQYETDLGSSGAGWELPGESAFTAHATNDTAPAPPAAQGTIYAISSTDPAVPIDIHNPVAALTFASPYNSIRFDNTLFSGEESALIDYRRSVPAGGSTTITWSYATGETLAETQGYAATAEQQFGAAVSIASPANGTTTQVSPLTVTGTGSAPSGIKSVTVNGVPAAVSGSSWSASVPLTPGSNTITATLTSAVGSTATSSESVTYAPVVPVVVTGSAAHVGRSSATLRGTVAPGSSAVHYHFDYGQTKAYGKQTPSGALPAGTTAVAVSAHVTGLKTGKTYHFRLVASGPAGTRNGQDMTFKPQAAPRRVTEAVSPHRARHAPYRFTASGKVALPRGVKSGAGCRGHVTINVALAGQVLSSKRVSLKRTCKYSGSLKFTASRLPGKGKLSFTAIFEGNNELSQKASHAVVVRFG